LVPSSTVRFRGGGGGSSGERPQHQHGVHVIENEDVQFILEERNTLAVGHSGVPQQQRTIQIKRVRSTTKGLQLLRGLYTIICVLFVGIFLAFCIQLLLNLVLDIAVISGETNSQSSERQWWHAPPLFLALIQFCHTFAEAMVIATRFVVDAWSGHYLVKEFFPSFFGTRKNLVVVDWLFFVFLLGMPLLVMIVTMFMNLDTFWVITGITWFSSVAFFFLVFALYTVYYEIRGAVRFVMNHDYPTIAATDAIPRDTFLQACKRCILMRQIRRYSGKKRARYFAKSIVDDDNDHETDTDTEDDEKDQVLDEKVDIVEGSYHEKMSIWSKVTMWSFLTKTLRLFHVLDKPRKLYNIDDAQGLRPFVTKWVRSILLYLFGLGCCT
jgi:hypothetical protein